MTALHSAEVLPRDAFIVFFRCCTSEVMRKGKMSLRCLFHPIPLNHGV